ncbi:hypothetical protein SYNPS1DRAFT_29971 [Syncephalis pseudoplumigaleata]|uniref:RRM domain-containing protein n=1 Tax=Syncephalis pseudoplumigaleata TaxID=1712513 RepID=A0A4P9YWG4_9FUNG|nr:hypothetical protein SYNPS1DRAFT_29971 [Syncephalis pseudoplumigaleata]|eukprot:RKP24264.1 hypothetical protein SYNPS1DRAFT_29971 [Syncephalis pseudoplumigaleata]
MPMGRGMGPPGGPPMGPGYGPPPPMPPPPHFGRHDGFPGRGREGFPGRGGPMPHWQGPGMLEPPPPGVTSLYVGGISPGINDVWMEQLLRVCGNVFRWTRGRDAEKKPKAYGFCEYVTPVDALRALRVLGGERREGGQPIELPVPGQPGEKKKLIIRAGEQVRAKLDEYEAQAETDQNEALDDSAAMEGVQAILKDMFEAAANNTLDDSANGAANEEEEVAPDLDPEQRQIVSREIAFFRESAAKRDRELKEREQEAKRRQEESERAARERFEPQPLKQSVLATRDARAGESSNRSGRLYYGVIYTYGWVLNNSRLVEEEDIEARIKSEKERDYEEVRAWHGMIWLCAANAYG